MLASQMVDHSHPSLTSNKRSVLFHHFMKFANSMFVELNITVVRNFMAFIFRALMANSSNCDEEET